MLGKLFIFYLALVIFLKKCVKFSGKMCGFENCFFVEKLLFFGSYCYAIYQRYFEIKSIP